ncbi:hypothetical protein P168DRAFT_320272 [Aspergillus campestris IBT 28561]|uniref:Uncharacterized protein n=1 Tax=Aspergillus campestris (strain IBT 28561) TaxID=1392248 RepID=A0A2I1CYL8_ASPC2|nr:uncharacterized protein P168DRAFT_320272 [Aspergillus campestris IBT 28561]PKY02727.1 hypothetical protein P168DRAFT_320272 [Aspergillus campestris IBT 28561]
MRFETIFLLALGGVASATRSAVVEGTTIYADGTTIWAENITPAPSVPQATRTVEIDGTTIHYDGTTIWTLAVVTATVH